IRSDPTSAACLFRAPCGVDPVPPMPAVITWLICAAVHSLGGIPMARGPSRRACLSVRPALQSGRPGPRCDMISDPIEFELFKNALFGVADEMALTVFRTTYSGVLKDNMDYSTALFDGDGVLVAQGLTLPGHLAS